MPDEDDDKPSIDMTSEVDQAFLSEEADRNSMDPKDHKRSVLQRCEENGWDPEELGIEVPDWYEGEAGNGDRAKAVDYEAVDDALLKAIKRSSWWADAYLNDEYNSLSKAPGIWRRDDQVPDYVQEVIEEVIETNDWDWAQFESLTSGQAQKLEEVLKEKLTQPQGWSVDTLSQDLQRELFLKEDVAVEVAVDTSHSVLNTAREEGYKRMEGSEEFVYRWVNPWDQRTTPVCREIKAEIEERGGSVTLPALKQIIRQKAQDYEGTNEGSGTPERVKQWLPHRRCCHTLVKED